MRRCKSSRYQKVSLWFAPSLANEFIVFNLSRNLWVGALADTGKASQRERLLPAPAVVYCVMALALWREAPLEEVLRVACEGLQWLGGGELPASGARDHLGVVAGTPTRRRRSGRIFSRPAGSLRCARIGPTLR